MSEAGSNPITGRKGLDHTDKAKIIPHLEYLEKEYQFFEAYRREVDWHLYQTQRAKRLEVERWVECLINATLDISKIFFAVKGEDVPETSREILFKIGSEIYKQRFFQIGARLYPPFFEHIRNQITS